ncbi:MAG: D-tyrosyl-tRNA(Tyr) deacylase [Coprobacillus sp.]|nr:D-tyrosyl-tRNA(Tyr) deacylase [Coprobacillus sp.]
MRVVLQIVQNAHVDIDGKTIASIQKGYLLLVGFQEGDDESILKEMLNKIVGLRIFADEQGKTNLSLDDVHGEILSVSQFTLYADTRKGRRPSFVNALAPQKAIILYDQWLSLLREIYPNAQSGVFGADMKVFLANDGPFTLILDSDELRRKNA